MPIATDHNVQVDYHPAAVKRRVRDYVSNLLKGRVLVSCGLLAEITVNDRYGSGDLVPAKGKVKVAVRVLGPAGRAPTGSSCTPTARRSARRGPPAAKAPG